MSLNKIQTNHHLPELLLELLLEAFPTIGRPGLYIAPLGIVLTQISSAGDSVLRTKQRHRLDIQTIDKHSSSQA